MAAKKVVIVGGVAGGAGCAARLRRMDETAEILLLDRGPHVSFANCGLPYYVGDVIRQESKLLLASPQLFHDRFRIEVRTRHEVLSIDREARAVAVRDLATGREYRESWDALVLSPGASPIVPPWPGVDLPGIFTLRSVPDSNALRAWIDEKKPTRAVVVGGGFIGLEMAENLVHRGMEVTLVEMAAQVLPPLDAEMAEYARQRLVERGVRVVLGDAVSAFQTGPGGSLAVRTRGGATYEAGMVVLSIGVRPETGLARAAGLEIGARGGIRVNEQMQTSDPRIFAVGDAVEVRNVVTDQWELIPLAGPANRQGRIAADVLCGRAARFRGVQGTAVCGFFDLTAAMTGASEKSLRRAGMDDFECVWLHPGHHVGYYPGAQTMHLKLLFRKSDGRLLGAQAVGGAGVERRIDVIAAAIQMKATVHDLEEAELCYAPQFGSAKDAVNMAGMIASNVVRGDAELAPWAEVGRGDAFLLDVREPAEFSAGAIPGAVNIPLGSLRARLDELPREREIRVNCGVGQRAYYACRILSQNGFRARNLSGGISTWKVMHPEGE
jgi:NADPH-dependent 2,4-dienoyl-CoA reductase/sulfur reductase-like enzyme/rhodanese-related sulfurtransferase